MFADTIKYTNFDGVEVSEEVRLNLTKMECRELDLKYEDEGGLFAHLKGLIRKKQDGETAVKPLYDFVKELIEHAYGVKSADGRRFIKTDENGRKLSESFTDSACFDELMDMLYTDKIDMEAFVTAIFPASDISEEERAASIEKTRAELGI